jgi:hypothetical protein
VYDFSDCITSSHDLMSATRFALMMLRYATTEAQKRDFGRRIDMSRWAIV